MFITFEGIEGVGKSTQLKFMAELLQQAGISVVLTREPGGTPMGEEIRDILLVHRYERVAPMTELLLMFAARAQHVDTIIKPALEKGQWVLCDRFVDATYAYQGGGRGVSMSLISGVEKLVLEDFHPDRTLILDAPAEIGFERVKGRGTHPDRFEQEKIDFFERVRSVYLARAKTDPKRYQVINAAESLMEVQTHISNIVADLIK